jgi:hypothetical protein
MSTQWHPLFAHLLGLLINKHYEIHPEVSVSDMPRVADLLVRRQGAEPAPFRGLWSHLTDWNVVEFKGPSDYPEEDDLELLVHVGTGLMYKFNEERRSRNEERLSNRQMSFWYLAPSLGETFLGQARTRTYLDYQTGGLWRGSVWGHPVWLVSYRELPVEEDTIPLHLLDRDPAAPRSLAELVLHKQELLQRFAPWFIAFQPALWEVIRQMANTSTDGPRIDWEAVGKYANLDEVVRVIPPERVIQLLGVDRAVQAVGLDRVIESSGAEKVLDELLKHLSPEQLQEMLRLRQQG